MPNDAIAKGVAFEPENHVWHLQNSSEIFVTRTVSRAENGAAFTRRDGALDGFTYAHEGQERTIDDFKKHAETTGLVILHKGELVHESYEKGADAGTLFATYSLVKSITTTLVGLAVADGFIQSVDDQLADYLPALKGTGYDGVTIKQAMEMSSGVAFDMVPWPDLPDTIEFITETAILGNRRSFEMAASYSRHTEPGTFFSYNTAESQILLELVRQTTGKSAALYLEEKLWRPLGMSHDAAWVLDKPGPDGAEFGGAFFNAAVRDWARFGQFIEQDGVWNGEALLPSDWVARAGQPNEPHLQFGKVFEGSERGYGWHWWPYPNGAFTASGAYGQTLYIDQAKDLVVARSSAWAEGYVAEHDEESFAFFTALGEWFAKNPDVDDNDEPLAVDNTASTAADTLE